MANQLRYWSSVKVNSRFIQLRTSSIGEPTEIIMKSKILAATTSAIITASLVGCATKPFEEDLVYKPLHADQTRVIPEASSTYIREVTPEEELMFRKVSLVGSVALIDALRSKLPNLTLKPLDEGVDMAKVINVYANDMFVKDYLEYLGSLSGYDVSFNKGALEIRSFISNEWNLAAFSSKRDVSLEVGASLGSGGGDSESGSEGNENSLSLEFDKDEWEDIIKGAQELLGGGSQSNAVVDTSMLKTTLTPFVNGVRSIGIISAGGAPNKMKALDSYLKNISTLGTKQVNIAVQAYDVTLNDSRGTGINWNELANIGGTLNGNPLGFGFESAPNQAVLDNTLFESTITYEGSQGKATAILNFLSSYGEVELLNQPNVTVRNGTYAYLHTGREIGFVAEVEIAEDNNSATAAPKIERIRVGVTLAVTPRILDDNRVLLDIWPVISDLDDSTDDQLFVIETEDGPDIPVTSPKIVLQELSTQVITESGEPIQMGGFIRRSIAKQLQDLPWKNRVTGKLLSPIFSSKANELQRQELVLMVTPTIIDDV